MTKIEWTDETWNPVRGCSRVSQGCYRCYAERDAARKNFNPKLPGYHGFAQFIQIGGKPQPHWTGKVELIESKLTEPLHWKKPRRVFVNSMSDLFHEALPDEAIDRVFAVIARCPQCTFQILTKRGDRMRQYAQITKAYGIPGGFSFASRWPLPNVWLGVSVEDQANKYRIDLLRRTPAAVRFLSIEPLLEDIGQLDLTGIHWVIVGGESGPQARPCDLQWIESIRDQCRVASVPLFVKQLGANPVDLLDNWDELDSKGGNWDQWPADLQIREFPRTVNPEPVPNLQPKTQKGKSR